MTYELYTFHPGVNYPVSLTSLDTDRIQDRCRHIVIIAHGVSGDDGDELDYRPFIMGKHPKTSGTELISNFLDSLPAGR